MRFVLFVLCIPAFLFGFAILASAQSAVHEIEAGIGFLVGAVFLVGASVVPRNNLLVSQPRFSAHNRRLRLRSAA